MERWLTIKIPQSREVSLGTFGWRRSLLLDVNLAVFDQHQTYFSSSSVVNAKTVHRLTGTTQTTVYTCYSLKHYGSQCWHRTTIITHCIGWKRWILVVACITVHPRVTQILALQGTAHCSLLPHDQRNDHLEYISVAQTDERIDSLADAVISLTLNAIWSYGQMNVKERNEN